jgi:hypothetical protein
MKSTQHFLVILMAFCGMFAPPARASAWSFYAQDSQQTTPTPEQEKKDPKKKDAKSKTPPTGNQPATVPTESAPKPLFGGQMNLKSSRQSKDTATLGFNGLDPNGQVQKGFLAAAPTSADVAKAQQLTRTGMNPADLTAFMQEGGLNAPGGQQ